jgi:hypothetical protein
MRSLSLVIALVVARALPAQEGPPASSRAVDRWPSIAGAALAFGMHESGHIVADLAFGVRPYLDAVRFGPLPFFAVAQRDPVTPRQWYVTSSAGLWIQGTTNELILASHPHLRDEHRPLLKGMFKFNVALSLGYGAAALFRVGPRERDPRGMARAIRISEPAMGVLILAPGLLDAYRYVHPEQRWPVWASRAVKLGSVALILRAAAR